MKLKYALIFFVVFSFLLADAQTVPGKEMHYQAVARDNSGAIMSNKKITVEIGIYAGSVLSWEEVHTVTTDQDGLFTLTIGGGTSTGAGNMTSYDLIEWGTALYSIRISMDYNAGSSFNLMGSSQLMSVPYTFQSLKTAQVQNLPLSKLKDVNTSKQKNGYILKWDPPFWKPFADNHSDTVLFSYQANHAITADSVKYAQKSLHTADSVNYAQNSGDAKHVLTAQNATNVKHAVHADTAKYTANNLLFNWSISGNVKIPTTKFIGSKDSSDLIFRTNNIENVRLPASKNVGIGITAPVASLHVKGVGGLLSEGTFGAGGLIDSANGTRFIWYPRKAAVCMGQMSANYWDDAKIGLYSFSAGYNCQARGLSAISLGINCKTMDSSGVSIGRNCLNYRLPSDPDGFGGSIAMGDSAVVSYTRSIGLGSRIVSSGACVFGYKNKGSGGGATAVFGSYNTNTSGYSIVFGTNGIISGKVGCFLFADASSTSAIASSQSNQFMVRASGGVVFYSDSLKSSGVEIASGSGSWSMLSDKNRKANFKSQEEAIVLKKISKLKIGSWSYKSETEEKEIKHVGPFAQDFYKAFKLGESNTLISSVDINGITLFGIKALERQTFNMQQSVNTAITEQQPAQLKSDLNSIEERLEKIETLLNK